MLRLNGETMKILKHAITITTILLLSGCAHLPTSYYNMDKKYQEEIITQKTQQQAMFSSMFAISVGVIGSGITMAAPEELKPTFLALTAAGFGLTAIITYLISDFEWETDAKILSEYRRIRENEVQMKKEKIYEKLERNKTNNY